MKSYFFFKKSVIGSILKALSAGFNSNELCLVLAILSQSFGYKTLSIAL